MNKFKRNRSGFTLIELLVVMIIVAILVAVGISLLQGNVRRAKFTEADSGLGTIRTHMRARLAEHGSYLLPAAPTLPGIGIRMRTLVAPIVPGDLDGRFFSEESYAIPGVGGPVTTATTYCAGVDGTLSVNAAGSGSVRANEVDGTNSPFFQRSMDQNGTIYNGNFTCTAGAGNVNVVN